MDYIKINDIDFSKTKMNKTYGLGLNTFYTDYDNELFYKLFHSMTDEKSKTIEKKFIELEKLNIEYISNALKLIYDNDNMIVGYVQKYISGDTLYKTIYKNGIYNEMKTLLELSKRLEYLHNNDIVVGDLHFNNIMINNNKEPIFIDAESYQIKGIESFETSILLNNYYVQKRIKLEKNKNSDIISFYLSFFERVFKRDILCTKLESYNSYLSNPYMKDLYNIFFELNKRSGRIPDIPYLHKVLKNYDNS